MVFLFTTACFAIGTTANVGMPDSNSGDAVYEDGAVEHKVEHKTVDGSTVPTTGVYGPSKSKFGDTDAKGRYIPGSNAKNRDDRSTYESSKAPEQRSTVKFKKYNTGTHTSTDGGTRY